MKKQIDKAVQSARKKYNHGSTVNGVDCDCDLCCGIMTGVETAFAISGNYISNDGTFPTDLVFANGRKVGIAFDGDKPYLTVGFDV